MEGDDIESYPWHQICIQFIMMKQVVSREQLFELIKDMETYFEGHEDYDKDHFTVDAVVNRMNLNLAKLDMTIANVRDALSGERLYTLCNTLRDSHSLQGFPCKPSEVAIVKLLVDTLLASERCMANPVDLCNACTGHSYRAASEVLQLLVHLQYFTLSQHTVSFGIRFLAEMQSYILSFFNDQLPLCNLCGEVDLHRQPCSVDCGLHMHYHCIKTLVARSGAPECPKEGCMGSFAGVLA